MKRFIGFCTVIFISLSMTSHGMDTQSPNAKLLLKLVKEGTVQLAHESNGTFNIQGLPAQVPPPATPPPTLATIIEPGITELSLDNISSSPDINRVVSYIAGIALLGVSAYYVFFRNRNTGIAPIIINIGSSPDFGIETVMREVGRINRGSISNHMSELLPGLAGLALLTYTTGRNYFGSSLYPLFRSRALTPSTPALPSRPIPPPVELTPRQLTFEPPAPQTDLERLAAWYWNASIEDRQTVIREAFPTVLEVALACHDFDGTVKILNNEIPLPEGDLTFQAVSLRRAYQLATALKQDNLKILINQKATRAAFLRPKTTN